MIGLLGLVLRWTFSRDKSTPEWPGSSPPGHPTPGQLGLTGSGHFGHPRPEAAEPPWSPEPVDAIPGPSPHQPAFPATAEISDIRDSGDFGLLVDATRVDSAEEAQRIRRVLADAGIRATTAPGPDGRYRVLVFAADVHRARRVANGH